MPAPRALLDTPRSVHATTVRANGTRNECDSSYTLSKPTDPFRTHTQKLDALHPMPLLPFRLAKRRSRAVEMLKRIDYVEVTKNERRTDRTVYVVAVYNHDTHSRIPVHGQFGRGVLTRLSTHNSHRSEPDAVVQVALDDFLQLRYDTYEIARSSHLMENCLFCHHAMGLNANSPVRPRWNTEWFKSDDEVCGMLTAYLTEMLKLATQVPVGGDDHCRGQERIPQLLQQFLRSYEHELDERQSF